MKNKDFNKDFFLIGSHQKSEVLLDASFLLSLFDENDNNNSLSEEMMNSLEEYGWDIFITTHIHTEVLNRLYQGFFETDIINQILKEETANDYVSLLLDDFFDEEEIKSIVEWSASFQGYPPINFRLKWVRIYKSEYRDYLMPYIREAINLQESYIIRYNIRVLNTGLLEYGIANKLIEDYKILVHDAYHVAASISNNIPYIATYDKDFQSIQELKTLELDMIS